VQTSRAWLVPDRGSISACFQRLTLPLWLACALVTPSCSSSKEGEPAVSAPLTVFDAGVKRLVVEVDYAADAPPFTGDLPGFGDPWAVTTTNIGRLIQGASRQLVVPNALASMEKLDDVTGETLTADQILAIASRHRGQASAGDTASIYVVFVNAYFADAGGKQADVLGVSLGTSGVVAMFKPVIAASDPGQGKVGNKIQIFVEQATMVHEIGHALGLVNNGFAMARPHQDAEHGTHCLNPSCSMYWTNEGASAAAAFVKQYITSRSAILFDADCLADADAAAAAAR
jgi:hypothetical protein